MNFPSIGKQPKKQVSVPKLSGGINMRDALTLIEDNQLIDGLNVWFKDNILKTRPGLVICNSDSFIESNCKTDVRREDVIKTINGATMRLISVHHKYYADDEKTGESVHSSSKLLFYFVGDTSGGRLLNSFESLSNIVTEKPITNYFVVQSKSDILCFVKCDAEAYGGAVYKYNKSQAEWVKVKTSDMYAPIIATHCVGGAKLHYNKSDIVSNGGVMVEGYNLIGEYYRMIYSTVNENEIDYSLEQSQQTSLMQYAAMNNLSDFALFGKELTAEIICIDGETHRHTVVLQGTNNWVIESEASAAAAGDGKYLMAKGNIIKFATTRDPSETASINASEYIEDNLTFKIPCVNTKENYAKVFGMTQSEWFGGAAVGINGGTRLFLGGNTSENDKHLLVWSGLNDPLYFNEECTAYVGNSSQGVTAFGRQDEMLVIFKERETYYTYYAQNTNITANSLIEQNVVNYTAENVYFPLVQLHSEIGCAYADTVVLCRNRLVWADKSGEVFTLVNNNQYSERNIFCISDMVGRRLKKEKFKTMFACDFEGHYVLFAENHIYVMCYESYGYVYASSYNKSEDAGVRIPWWYWEVNLPERIKTAFVCDGTLMCVTFTENETSTIGFCSFNGDDGRDNGTDITSHLTTKLFDFGAPSRLKNVPLINIAFGNNEGRVIKVNFVTEQGNNEDEIIRVFESNTDEYAADYVHNRRLRPCVRLINRIGVRVECSGKLSVDSISLEYRILGGA